MEKDKKDVYTAIVLQGGAALGSYECGVLKELFASRPGFKPDVVTGISIGAVNAAILAGAGEPIPILEKVWHEFGELPHLTAFFERAYELMPQTIQQFFLRFGNEGMYRVRPEYVLNPFLAPLITDSYCDTAPLRDTLKKYVDPDALNNYCQVVVSAVNIESGQLETFGNAEAMRAGGKYNNEQALSIDHVLASASLPPGFPMTRLKEDGNLRGYYWDGGLHSNTPLSEAINCLEQCGPDDPDAKREIIVVELFPMEGPKPENMEQVYSRFFNMIYSSKLKLDEKLFSNYFDFIDLVEQLNLLLQTIDGALAVKKTLDQALANVHPGITVDGIHDNPGFKTLMEHRRIDAFTKIQFTQRNLGNGLDFSRKSIDARIKAGQTDARDQKIKDYHFLRETPVPRKMVVPRKIKKAA